VKVIKIPKRNGTYRTVVVPTQEKKAELRKFIPYLQATCLLLDQEEIMQGFLPARSPVTNATKHIGFPYSVCFDLQDFFDHVTWSRLRDVSSRFNGPNFVPINYNWESMLYGDRAAQGLPTSPLLANIAAVPLDRNILEHVKFTRNNSRLPCVYTRYADDLTISCHSQEDVDYFLDMVPRCCTLRSFSVNEKKTHVQCSTAGRRIITGVAVDDKGVYPTRQMKRKLRAAEHNHSKSVAGLREWIKTKLPTTEAFVEKLLTKSDEATELQVTKPSDDPNNNLGRGLRALHQAFQLQLALKDLNDWDPKDVILEETTDERLDRLVQEVLNL
jgi:hypothetical protein